MSRAGAETSEAGSVAERLAAALETELRDKWHGEAGGVDLRSYRCPSADADELRRRVLHTLADEGWKIDAAPPRRAQGWTLRARKGDALLSVGCIAVPKPHDPAPYLWFWRERCTDR